MRIQNNIKKVDVTSFGYGDILVTDGGFHILVIKDSDGKDYRGLILENNRPTAIECTRRDLLSVISNDFYAVGKVVDIIKAEKVSVHFDN